jgi:anti-repressor protein
MEMGLFKIKESVVNHPSGYTHINKTPKVTGRGQTYFVNLFLRKQAA